MKKALSPLLKTKDNVVHAGLSLPLVLLKVLNSFLLEILLVYPNNNLLIALLGIMVAVVV
jgi:hypothetical protein